jgi:hypothetical protein
MAAKLDEALFRILAEGQAEPALNRFIETTIEAHATGVADSPCADDALIAALALILLLKTPDGRRALKLKRRPRGREIDKKHIRLGDPPYQIALRFHLGEIDEKTAMEQLSDCLPAAAADQNEKTLRALLHDLASDIPGWLAIAESCRNDAITHAAYRRFLNADEE